jgi:hypothetical protein
VSSTKTRRQCERAFLTEAELCAWLGAASPGSSLCYYRGFLAIDCGAAASGLDTKQRAELQRLAKRAVFAVEKGLAHVVQRRHGPADFSYLLVARRRVNPKDRRIRPLEGG